MLPTESLQDAFLFLSRDDLDAVQLVTGILNTVVAKMPEDSPVRQIAWLYLKNGSEGSLQLEVVRDESNIGKKNTLVESTDILRFVRNARISTLSFGTLFNAAVDWESLVDNLLCLKSLLSSAYVHKGTIGLRLPPPGPLLRSLFEDILDTRVGVNFSCGEIDVGRGELLSLPALRSSTELFLSTNSPVIDSADDVDNFINWLHAPTDGLKVFTHSMVPLPTNPRCLDNLKLTDDMWDTFREKMFQRFEDADRLLIFTAAVVFPAAAEIPLSEREGFVNTDTNEILMFSVRGPMYGMTDQHVLVRRGPLPE